MVCRSEPDGLNEDSKIIPMENNSFDFDSREIEELYSEIGHLLFVALSSKPDLIFDVCRLIPNVGSIDSKQVFKETICGSSLGTG